jgi:acyl-CoA dehydrogenase
MEFELSTEQKEIQELALKFARNEMFPVSQQYDEEGKFPKEIFKKAWELGLINTCIPAEYGGTGFSSLDAVVISEALAWGCMGMNTSFMANDLALLPIVIGGSDEQKKKFDLIYPVGTSVFEGIKN